MRATRGSWRNRNRKSLMQRHFSTAWAFRPKPLQGTHHRRRRRARIPHVRSVSARRRAPSVAAGVIHGRGRRSRTTVHVRFAPKASEISALPRIDARGQNRALWLYTRGGEEAFFCELSEWLTQDPKDVAVW